MRSASSTSSHTSETAMSRPAMDTSRCQTQHQGESLKELEANETSITMVSITFEQTMSFGAIDGFIPIAYNVAEHGFESSRK